MLLKYLKKNVERDGKRHHGFLVSSLVAAAREESHDYMSNGGGDCEFKK